MKKGGMVNSNEMKKRKKERMKRGGMMINRNERKKRKKVVKIGG